ncbi:clasp N terminal-domain-containing protein [Coprinopsis sp. MPI-PUGE-AT-0042]|nr:clasp N terminal-domain-containing protein [Coprinopsis sp. MPI-PUGE-AT-0042]
MSSEDSQLDKLITQLKSNDVDVKVDVLAKLQQEFESGVEITDPDPIISALKACLRVSNQHLTSATLYAIPPLLPLIISRSVAPGQSTPSSTSSGVIDVPTLRYVVTAFLPPGGIIDRLGDKERPQAKAREALVMLGGYAFRAGGPSVMASKSGKGVETPLMIFERCIKEGGLASKVWKIKEQCILTLVQIRRAHIQFPIRPYLSLLVDCLEDTDAHVRDCARTSVVELFAGPGVTDAARADLKKEMTKKNVRKTIVEGVLAKLMAAGNATGPGSVDGASDRSTGPPDSTSKTKEYIPPSLRLAGGAGAASQTAFRPRLASASSGVPKTSSSSSLAQSTARPPSRAAAVASPPPGPQTPASESAGADVKAVYIASSRELESEFQAMAKPFEGKESEHNWSARESAIQRVRGMIKGDVHNRYPDVFFAGLKDGFMQWSLKTLASLRTTVAINTCLMYSEMAVAFGRELDPYCDLLLTNLLKMAGFTKKLTAQQSQICVTDIIVHTSAPARIIMPLLWTTLQEKTVQARASVVAHFKKYIEVHGARAKPHIEGAGSFDVLEKSVKKALADSNPAVRENSRVMFWTFHSVWPEHAMAILNNLDGTAKKQLEKACPDPSVAGGSDSKTTQAPKKSSIAAAIAASRAKAKAIAAAPPSLRHQATSSQTPGTTRPSGSPSLSTSPKSSYAPLRTVSTPGSPPSLRPRAPVAAPRSVSSTVVPGTHARTPSNGSNGVKRAHSPSLSDQVAASRRRTSSPLAPSTGGLRKAIATALPASPPTVAGQLSPPRRPSGLGIKAGPVPVPNRQSLLLPNVSNFRDESLLIASTVPIPEDDDDDLEDDHSVNLMSFTAAYNKTNGVQRSPPNPLSLSPKSNASRPTVFSNALSSGSLSDAGSGRMGHEQPVVEDALRARAEQAESAAERLLELVDDDDLQMPMMPTSIKVRHSMGQPSSNAYNGGATIREKPKTRPAPLPPTSAFNSQPPVTPKNNRANLILKQAAMFKDSPVNKKTSSLLDVLHAQRHETGWWLKRMTLYSKMAPSQSQSDEERAAEIDSLVQALGEKEVSKETLQQIAAVCVANCVADPATPSSPSPFDTQTLSDTLHSEVWEKNRNFDRLFKGLLRVLEPSKPEDILEYGLIALWEMLENQATYLEGREADLFSMLLSLRYCNKVNVLEATSTIRDALTAKVDPVYGLTTFHSCLKAFHAEEHPECSEKDIKSVTYAFGLIALGKFILRLPAEIAEEELPRLKSTLITALNDRSSLIIRESAAASIIAAQLVLRDEAHLFTLLDGLADDKKNLLTYLFDKHGARDAQLSAADDNMNGKPSGLAKFEKEILRLDSRTSTPSRVGR